VALTYRKENSPSAPTQNVNPVTPSSAPIGAGTGPIVTPSGYFFPLPSNSSSDARAGATSRDGNALTQAKERAVEPSSSAGKEGEPESPKGPRTQAQFSELNKSEGKNYRVFEGTLIETVLTNRLNGDFAGPINCMVTTNLYSHDGEQLLVPQGSRVLGEVKRVTTFGQERLAVVFHRLIMPDGYSVSLDRFKGLNQIGETGLRDQINHHYLQIFGVSLAVGAIAGLAQADTRAGAFQSSTDAYRQGVADSLSQSSLRILDRYLNVLPTLTIREGHRVKIYLSDDLLMPAYKNHRMPGDL
jgi:type IV secretion system protein VirB10